MAKKAKPVKSVKVAPAFRTPPAPVTPPALPTSLAQAVPPTQPEVFGSPANRPVNQTVGGVQQLPFPKG